MNDKIMVFIGCHYLKLELRDAELVAAIQAPYQLGWG